MILYPTLLLALAGLAVSHANARKTYQPETAPAISCTGDRIVWVNTDTGIYHLPGMRWYGRTNSGEYKCRKDAERDGDRATKNRQ